MNENLTNDDGKEFKVCEANSAPAFQGVEGCLSTLNVPQEIYNFVRVRLGIREDKK